MSYTYRRQPVKALYLTYQLLSTAFVRLPLWLILAVPRSLRPRPTWSIKRTILVKLIRHYFAVLGRTGLIVKLPNHQAITPGPNVNGVWINPVSELVTGDLKTWMDVASVSPIRIPGYWTHKKGSSIETESPPKPSEKVLYHLHGGAYIRLSAHPTDRTAAIARGFVKHVDSIHRTFAVEYRLSSSKPFETANPFPAALLDALAGYNYLVNVVGFAPSNIVIAGDSAGGNLAHALTRYLVEYKDSPDVRLPSPPGALVLLSPWTDLSASHESPEGSGFRMAGSDYLGRPTGFSYPKLSFLGPLGMGAATSNKYISPASLHPSMSVDFHGFPRTFIVGGGAEILIDQIHTFRDRMVRDLGEGDGVKPGDGLVRYYEAPDAIHDYLAFPWHDPERTETFKAIAQWVDPL